MNREGEEMRDEILGEALRRLEVPEHAPGFEDRLRAHLGEDLATRETIPHSDEAEGWTARRRRVKRAGR